MTTVTLPLAVPTPSHLRCWTGRVLSAIVTLFLVADGAAKVARIPQVLEASGKFGFSSTDVVAIGAVLLSCVALYAVPATATLGAVLLTGYLGGAVATNLRAHAPLATHVLFPVWFGMLAWAGLVLRRPGLLALLRT